MTAVQTTRGRPREHRLPFQPLEEALRRQLPVIVLGGNFVGCSVNRMANLLDVHPRQIHRWRHEGVRWTRADKLAVRAGLHPGEIWPQWWMEDWT